MSVNSLQSLLNKMKGRSITSGWGAVAAFGRTQLNQLLEEQYLEWLHEGRFIPPINGDVYTDSGAEVMTLDNLILGKPVLSFAQASLNQPKVFLTINIVAGTYTAINRPDSGAHRLLSSFSITEDMGYKIEMTVDLNQVTGEVDKRGRVTVDLASDPKMTCNLGNAGGVQKNVATFIQGRLAALPEDLRTFELGLFDFSGYNPLSPVSFHIRTQKAPGIENGDGAVLLFIRLKIDDENGSLPIEGSDFPYLIPDDQVSRQASYSASLVLNREWVELLDEVQLDVLKSLLLPGKALFVESDNGRYTPHDLLVLGNIKPSDKHVRIEPSFISLKSGGKTQAFTARKSDGASVSAQWSVSNPVSPLSVGEITPAGGVYTPPAQSRMGNHQQPVVVTANYVMNGRQQSSSALVLGMFESMSISPRVSVSGVGYGASPIHLKAATQGQGKLQWPTLTPSEGTLEIIDDNHAIYKPPVDASAPITLQTITVTDSLTKESIDATIVLMRSAHTLPVDPPYVPAIFAGSPIQLYGDLDPEYARWTVIGEGEVDENGLFTPPLRPTSRVSVVRCSLVVGGAVMASGLSIIQLSEQEQPQPRWEEIAEFSIEAQGNSRCYSNGYQQIPVVIKLETKPISIGGQQSYIPVSDAQLSTLRLVDKFSNTRIPFVPFAQEGIEYGSGVSWATSKKRNRFRLYSATAVAQTESPHVPAPQNNGTSYVELWVHVAVEGFRTFYAQFDSHRGTENSTDEKQGGPDEVTVEGILPQPPELQQYTFERKRVWKDPDGRDLPPTTAAPEWDYFSMYRQSIDHWSLKYSRLGAYPVQFAVASIKENISSIQWESELLDEEFCSYTGCAFNPANFENSDSPSPEEMSFDPYLWALMKTRSKTLATDFNDNKPAPGVWVMGLYRTDNLKYWYDGLANGDKRKLYRKHLDKNIQLVLIDQEGNRHSLLVKFEDKNLHDSRNTLVIDRN